MLSKIKNNGNRVFLPSGRWLEKGEELTVATPEARLLAITNPNIVIIEEKKKKR